MKVFYYCYGGAHTSVVAAALHTERLPLGEVADAAAIAALPLFDRVPNRDIGKVFPAGIAPGGEEVYVVGFGPQRKVVCRAVKSYLSLKGVDDGSYLLVDALNCAGLIVRLGGLLSRRLGWVALGRPLAAAGIRGSYRSLVALVQRTRERATGRGAGFP